MKMVTTTIRTDSGERIVRERERAGLQGMSLYEIKGIGGRCCFMNHENTFPMPETVEIDWRRILT